MAAGGEKVLAMRPKVTLRIFRFDPEGDQQPRYDNFEVPLAERMTVLDALFEISDKQDSSLAFRYSCRGAVCGSCGLYINGAYRLACETRLESLNSNEVTINPLPHLPIIKDLVVDMEPFFEKYRRVVPYLKTQTSPPEKEWAQSIKQRKVIDEMVDCILCACCHSACPVVWTDPEYLGPAALTKAYRFVADSRDEAAEERLKVVSGEDGVWRCHTIFNCAQACPKKINPTYSIQRLKGKSVVQKLKFWR